MDIEFEATFQNIDKDEIRRRLKRIGASLVRKEFLQKRVVFNLPLGNEIEGGWLRVRNEGDKVTMSLKVVDGTAIKNQKEICLTVDNFERAMFFLESIGCRKKAYQESKRELWILGEVELALDEWPFLEPFLEVEGPSEKLVREVSLKLGLNYSTAKFGAVDLLYSEKYGISKDKINNQTPKIIFAGNNPFIK